MVGLASSAHPTSGATQLTTPMSNENFEPKIVGFCCNWCSYRAADLAGTARIKYAPNVRVIRVMCSGRVDPSFVMKALASGADGVLIAGCHPGECHYIEQNYKAMRRYSILKHTLRAMGVESERVRLVWASAAEGQQLADAIDQLVEDVRKLGPLKWPGNWSENGQRTRPWRRSSKSTKKPWRSFNRRVGQACVASAGPPDESNEDGGPATQACPTLRILENYHDSNHHRKETRQGQAGHLLGRVVRRLRDFHLADRRQDPRTSTPPSTWSSALASADGKVRDIEKMADGEIDVCLFNGGIRNSEQEYMARLLRQKSKILVAFGSCDSEGCIPGLGNLDDRKSIFATVYDPDSATAPGQPAENLSAARNAGARRHALSAGVLRHPEDAPPDGQRQLLPARLPSGGRRDLEGARGDRRGQAAAQGLDPRRRYDRLRGVQAEAEREEDQEVPPHLGDHSGRGDLPAGAGPDVLRHRHAGRLRGPVSCGKLALYRLPRSERGRR